jgi:sodium-coupled monocarboxylate transporter 8/12
MEKRFDSRILRQIGAAIFLLSTLFYMAVVMYAPAVALVGVTGLPLWTFILVSKFYILLDLIINY